jgi:hypothetical protein
MVPKGPSWQGLIEFIELVQPIPREAALNCLLSEEEHNQEVTK